jgi:glycosyltransferase involved in cell wall biosynthesis
MENIETAKRTIMTTRLEMSRLCQALGNDPWKLVPNAAYNACTNPSVTVLITLFNYSDYIQECLDSVCAAIADQLPGGFDVLVIDDCSTDRSAQIVEDYIQQASTPICLVKKQFNTGLGDARNIGLKLARAPFVFILDADNWIYPNCLSVLYNAIVSSGCAAVYGIINRFNQKTQEGIGLLSYYEWDVRELISEPYIDAMAMFKKDIVLQVGSYSTELMCIAWSGWEDYDLWLKLAQAKQPCKLIPRILSAYRVHPTSMISTTNNYAQTIAQYFTKKFARLLEEYPDLPRTFGFPRQTLFEPAPNPLAGQLQEAQEQLKRSQERIQELERELSEAKGRLAAMTQQKSGESRSGWFNLKQI